MNYEKCLYKGLGKMKNKCVQNGVLKDDDELDTMFVHNVQLKCR